jgi:hypothetical protein
VDAVNTALNRSLAAAPVLSSARRETFRYAAQLVVLLLVLSVYYAFAATAGTFGDLSWHTDYYDVLADGFRQGHLYIPELPQHRLLTRLNPYDYRHVDLWLWDASLYHGRYYIYWGPTPALCLLALKWLTGLQAKLYDQWLVLAFMLGRLYAGAGLIVSFAAAGGVRRPRWAVLLLIAVFALASPTPYFMARPVIYEASIAGGQCFLFCGLLAAYWGLAKPRRRTLLFVLAGTFWGMALGSRGSLFLVAPWLVLITALFAQRDSGWKLRPVLRDLFALGVPVALCIVLYAVYNYERFDSIREFGLKYQLTWRPFTGKRRYVLPNLVSYLSSNLGWSCEFPYVRIPIHQHLSKLIRWPDDYEIGDYDKGERVAGLFVGTAFCWLLFVWLWRGFLGARRLLNEGRVVGLSRAEAWLLACAGAILCSMIPASRMYMANMRFLEDGVAAPLLAAGLAGLWLLRQTHSSPRKLVRALGPLTYIGLAAYTIFVGVCLGFSGHYDNFEKENEPLFKHLVEKYSVCPEGVVTREDATPPSQE